MNNRFKKKMIKLLWIYILLILFFLAGLLVWWEINIGPVNESDTTTKTITINKGESLYQITSKLASLGLIKNSFVFDLLIKQKGLSDKIQAGNFHLSPAMDAGTIAQTLLKGTSDIKITIPEGKRAEEIADTLQTDLTSYQDVWRKQLLENEGYLFPDTYYFTQDTSIDTIISVMRENFNKKYANISNRTTLTQQQIVTIASLVEREAKFPEDASLVASVIINRINSGMPLQIDATIQYALGSRTNWWPQLKDSGSNLIPNSVFNTYTHSGLPPTPISNPGFFVLNAVGTAPHTNYLYYISDKTGHNHYAKTLQEHNNNIQKYGL